jgi:hypothetical protein
LYLLLFGIYVMPMAWTVMTLVFALYHVCSWCCPHVDVVAVLNDQFY